MSRTLHEEAADPRTAPERLWELARKHPELSRELAQNPASPAALLERLANRAEAATGELLARNPNTPSPLLLGELGQKFPQALLENPALPLLLLEHPDLPLSMPANTLLRLLAQEQSPPLFLELSARHKDHRVRQAVAQSLSPAARDALLFLSQDTDEEIRRLVAQNPRAPAEALTALSEDSSREVRRHAAQNPATPAATIASLCRAGAGPDLVRYGTPDPELSAEELWRLSEGGPWARELAARHPQATAELLARLGGDKEPRVRREVARNPLTPKPTLSSLAGDPDGDTRWWVASNPCCPPELLEQLILEDRIRWELASRTIPPALLERLAEDPEVLVRQRVAQNPSTPLPALERLARDPLPVVREAVTRNPAAPERLRA